MLTRRLLLVTPVAVVAATRARNKAYARDAANPPPGATYRALFAEQDKIDQQLVDDERRAVVSKAFPDYPKAVIAQLDKDVVVDLEFMLGVFPEPPLPPKGRMFLRQWILRYLEDESASSETKEFLDAVLRYYQLL